MTQQASRSCPRCGNEVPAGQRFCSNCGLSISDEGNRPTALSGETPSDVSNMATREATPTPPPPPMDGPQYTRYPPNGGGYSQSTPPPPPMNPGQMPSQPASVPAYAQPQKGNSGKVWRGIGCGVGIAVLILLVICGTIGYFLYNGAKTGLSSLSKTATANPAYGSGGGSNDVTPTLGPTTKTTIGSTITYASDNITITDVQQAQSFSDDSSSQSTGVARLDLKEQNTASGNADFVYSSIARLMLPDGSTVEPSNESHGVSPDASVSRTNWVDFPVPTTVKPSQMTLVLGSNEDAQMSIPLAASADLSKYKDKTSTPNKTFQHEGLNWTMTNATLSWSNAAVQAKKGMLYVSIDFKIDNPSQKDVSEYWNSSMRLKAGDTESSPESATNFPTSYPAGSSGKTGQAVFLVPQGSSTSYTFILLASSDGSVPQTTADFQVQ